MEHQKVTQITESERQRAGHAPTECEPCARTATHSILQLQRMIGNQGVQYLIQAKLRVDASNDEYEQEADQVATQVMRMPNTSEAPLQRKCSCDGELELDGEDCEACRYKRLALQRRSTSHNKLSGIPPTVHDVLNAPGHPLDQVTRSFFESRFGYDFSHVRIHDETYAQRASREVNAEAFTIGNSIAFASGRYTPHTFAGRHLLAHELTHVIQQGGYRRKPQTKMIQRAVDDEAAEASSTEKQKWQATKQTSESTAAPIVNQVLSNGNGQPLPASTRAFFEPQFGTDFSQVRVHTDGQAAELAHSIQAKPFTTGQDVVFGAGQFAPEHTEGKRLLAHEVTHVLQQPHVPTIQRQTTDQPPTADDPALAASLEQKIEAAAADASQDADLMLRASASRMHLLLTRAHRPLKKTEDLDAIVADCEKLAQTELDTLGAFSPAGGELALAAYPRGFPLTWSGRIQAALTLGVEPATIVTDWARSLKDLTAKSTTIGLEIYALGLPVPLSDLDRLNDFRLRLADAKANKPSAVRDFARESIRYMQLKWVSAFAFSWEMIVNEIASAVAEGKVVANYLDWMDFVNNKQAILRDLPTRARDRLAQTEEEAQQIQTDAVKLGDAALLVGMASALRSLFGLLTGWNEASALFDTALKTADAAVASSDKGNRFVAALRWALNNNYFGGTAAAWVHNLIDQGPKILEEIALIVILGMIPGVDIAVAAYLLLTTARDVVGMLDELAASLKGVMQAKSVGELQKASARLAQILTNGAIFILIVLVTEGIGKAVARLRKGATELRAADKTLTEEAATKKAFEQMSAEERKALEEGTASTAKRLTKKFEEFEGACALGSIICRKLPDHVVDEIGEYPKDRGVPMPGGTFTIQKAVLSGVARGTERLRGIARENRHLWPDFDKALAQAEKQGKGWVYDSAGEPWEVHHVKPVFFGGDNAPDNLFPLPKSVHQKYTNWWNDLHRAFKRRFTDDEWDRIYWSEKDVPGSRVPKTPKR